jgi:hypothetical protein
LAGPWRSKASRTSGQRSQNSRFVEQREEWVDGPPVIDQLDALGWYNLFGS